MVRAWPEAWAPREEDKGVTRSVEITRDARLNEEGDNSN